MPGTFHHEEIYRGADAIPKLAALRLTLCGAGALGSHLADNLVRQGFRQLRVIDRDRIEQHNVGTQLYGESEVGAHKVDVLRNRLFAATGVEIDAVNKELTAGNAARLLKHGELVVDTFDNSISRKLVQEHCRAADIACLHVGLFADYCEIIWDERYRVPHEAGRDVCDYPLARNLVLLAVAIASEAIVRYALTADRPNWTATLTDFAVRPLEL